MTDNQWQHRVLQNCPYLWANHKECYCVEITSSKVCDAIRYCGTNYLDCPVFHKLRQQGAITAEAESSPPDKGGLLYRLRRE
ncbi:hypothetical protein [Trichlorobacter ammonificans]|uniref:Uncharacterized protein n=1 Tax=Trichlorobacter ammonificans TaxID=2916410 RepID=A0ABN8HEC5_9BACT|nr:hypothetical protein [Trichlorobacter ammonificans]CAH2031154.1 protein of unknown function [Trichlorobacter ammonificans]